LDVVIAPLTVNKHYTSLVTFEKLKTFVTDLKQSLENMHKDVYAKVEAHRESMRKKANLNAKPTMFSEGDFVLVAKVQNAIRNKLQVNWTGPYRIVEVISDWIFRCENLLDPSKTVISHAQRLKFYSDNLLNDKDTLLSYMQASENDKYTIDSLLDIRIANSSYDVLVSWLGFPDENTWEPIENLYEDVPLLLRQFLLNFPKGKEIFDSLSRP
jgi:hypothetical protein